MPWRQLMDTCPKCNSLCVVPIIYGKPTSSLSEAAAMGLVVLGGCVMDDSQANAQCRRCQFAWLRREADRLSRDDFRDLISQFHQFLRDTSRQIESSLDGLSQESIEYGRSLGGRNAAARLRSIMDARIAISASLGEIEQRLSWESEKLEELIYGWRK